MLKKSLGVIAVIVFAFTVLFISILRSASVRYSFSSVGAKTTDQLLTKDVEGLENLEIDYYLAFPGAVLPDSPLWALKATRDKLWLALTTNENKKAELNLLFADKRVLSARILFERGKYDLGYTTLTKAEKYLEEACNIENEMRARGQDTSELAERLINASLKHRLVIRQILLLAPDEAKPKISTVAQFSRGVYGSLIHVLKDRNMVVPEDPFNGL